MRQFTRQSARPASPEMYRAAARRLRRFAEQLEARAAPSTPQEKRQLTRTVHSLAYSVRALRQRHDRIEPTQVEEPTI